MLNELKKIDDLTLMSYKSKPVYVHNDHRFVLPLIYDAQQKGLIPKPCKFFMFDAHHDLADPSPDAIKELKNLRQKFDEDGFFDLVQNELRGDDADWLKAAMELGWVSDVIISGIRHDLDEETPFIYIDASGTEHTVFHEISFPGSMLEYQGDLSDHARKRELERFWKILDWDDKSSIYHFKESDEKIMLNFDLDAFSMNYDTFLFPWDRTVYEKRFLEVSDYFTTKGWSGKLFTQSLAEKAGVITIAREPDYCGGINNMKQIFSDVNKIIFDNLIK